MNALNEVFSRSFPASGMDKKKKVASEDEKLHGEGIKTGSIDRFNPYRDEAFVIFFFFNFEQFCLIISRKKK